MPVIALKINIKDRTTTITITTAAATTAAIVAFMKIHATDKRRHCPFTRKTTRANANAAGYIVGSDVNVDVGVNSDVDNDVIVWTLSLLLWP